MASVTETRRKRRKSSRMRDFVDGVATVMDLTGSLTEAESHHYERRLRAQAAEAEAAAAAYQSGVGVTAFTKQVGAFLTRAGSIAEREGYFTELPPNSLRPPSQS
jgi:hypothetical protein